MVNHMLPRDQLSANSVNYTQRAEIFRKYISEAISFYSIQVDSINIQPANFEGGASLNPIKSSEKEIVLTFGRRGDVDELDLRRQAWHEVAHWQLFLEGYPLLHANRPESTLNWVKLDKNKIHNMLDPQKKLSVDGSYWIFFLVNQALSDVIVSRKISCTPVFRDTMLALANKNAKLVLKHHSKGELCFTAIGKT